jgi:hypothetical protein
MSIGNLTAIFSETHSPLKKNEEINKKQSNKQTDKQPSRKHVTLYIIYAFECEIILKKG